MSHDHEPLFVKPYGDTLNDGKIQLSFTLPVASGPKAASAAVKLANQMGVKDASVVHQAALSAEFTFFVLYGAIQHQVDYSSLVVSEREEKALSIAEADAMIREQVGRKLVVVGASTGTDAHTVGIDAIMNRKGFAGHYGLERYEMLETFNLGSQVQNEALLQQAMIINADVCLVSQTVTQKDVHIKNLTQLIELAEAEGVRENMIFICGGARINHELAKELGYDAGFGSGKFADDVATFMIQEFIRRQEQKRREKLRVNK
jgi:beta-lysine 5,6-aminomutase beta subunit